MKKFVLTAILLFSTVGLWSSQVQAAYNFGDFRSETLVSKAWGALAAEDVEAVLAYTNKCIELYAEEAKKMQASLADFPKGNKDEVFGYWALNDVATSLFIQGEAYRKAKMIDEAIEIYNTLIKEYTYGQTWDSKGWFWKPAEAAKEKLAMINTGLDLDYGDHSSSYLTAQAWRSLSNKDTSAVLAYVDKTLELYGQQAKQMQDSLTEYPWESKDKVFSYWALNDVGTALFIKGEALKKDGQIDEAKVVYSQLVHDYYYAQCWDAGGWFWKPAEEAQRVLEELNAI